MSPNPSSPLAIPQSAESPSLQSLAQEGSLATTFPGAAPGTSLEAEHLQLASRHSWAIKTPLATQSWGQRVHTHKCQCLRP